MEAIAVIVLVLIIIVLICYKKTDPVKVEALRIKRQLEVEALRKEELLKKIGPISPAYICPHCKEKGHVHTIHVKRKKGVSGAKVTGALLTCGVSVLATGLSRKEGLTQAYCENCNSTWDF